MGYTVLSQVTWEQPKPMRGDFVPHWLWLFVCHPPPPPTPPPPPPPHPTPPPLPRSLNSSVWKFLILEISYSQKYLLCSSITLIFEGCRRVDRGPQVSDSLMRQTLPQLANADPLSTCGVWRCVEHLMKSVWNTSRWVYHMEYIGNVRCLSLFGLSPIKNINDLVVFIVVVITVLCGFMWFIYQAHILLGCFSGAVVMILVRSATANKINHTSIYIKAQTMYT